LKKILKKKSLWEFRDFLERKIWREIFRKDADNARRKCKTAKMKSQEKDEKK
jgi:hypothetical protein